MVAVSAQSSKSGSTAQGDESQSDDFVKAVELVVESGRPSASYIQRQLRAGYNKASRYVELMETMGVVGPPKGAKGREVFWQTADIEKWKSSR
jgi:S-DNA-T family DNA segregation ATPase FtsK/SpoIIIE